MRRLGKGITKKITNIQSQSQGPSTRRGDQRAGTLGIEVCDVCNICFYSKTSLSVHKRIHWRDCIFDCPNCNKRFSSLINLRAHQKTHCFTTTATSNSPTRTSKSPTRTSKSPVKTSKYPTRTSESITRTSKSPTKKAKFHGQLTESATKNTLLIAKIKATTKINKTKIISNTIKSINNIMSPKKRVLLTEGEYRCKICDKVCIGKLGLGSHARSHKEPPPPAKSSKTWIYVNKKDVKTKMAGTTMACLLCKKTFFEERGLTKHIRESHRGQDMSEIDNIRPEGAIPCENCDMVFNNDKALILHNKSCSKEMDQDDEDEEDEDDDEYYEERLKNSKRLELSKTSSHKCQFCGIKFNNRLSLSNHSRVHENKEKKPNNNQHKKAIAIKSKIHTEKTLVKDLKNEPVKVQRKNEPVKVQRKNEPVKVSKKNEPVKVSKKNESLKGLKKKETLKETEDLKAMKINITKKNKQEMEKLPSFESISCHVCKEKFNRGLSFSHHLRMKHPGEPYPLKRNIGLKVKAHKIKFPYKCKDCLKSFAKISRYHFHKKYKSLCKVKTPVVNSEECKKSVVLVEKLNDKLVRMIAGNEAVSESENSSSHDEIMDTEISGKNKDAQVVEEIIAPIHFVVENGKIKEKELDNDEVKGPEDLATGKLEPDENLVNGKEEKDEKKEPGEEIPMEIEESNKIVVEKEFAQDCGEIVESPIHMIKNASDLEIVTVEDSIDIVEVEIGDIVDKESVHGTDDVIPLEAPINDEEIIVPKIAPVINSNAPAAATLEKSSNDEAKDESEKKVESVSNGGSPTKIAESEEVPKLTEDKTNLEKDGENPELKGIIDFINNDCSE